MVGEGNHVMWLITAGLIGFVSAFIAGLLLHRRRARDCGLGKLCQLPKEYEEFIVTPSLRD